MIQKAQTRLLADLKKKAESAQKTGDLKTFEQIQAETKAFEQNGVLPTTVSVRLYESQMRSARMRLEDSYGMAVKQYTKEGQIDLAKAVQAELDKFKTGSAWPMDAVPWGNKYYKVFDTNLT